ncbi:GNAT family N-acetyltransferase [Gordonia sp. i37]|uniref:GNAT family N-acetyltransferase n=1 Tax=Gordonia sp. i37 TaxID=1961707 RepID=UPI0009AE252F|nr:N-acetyltransferase [Gordonia sp. i37]OPX15153.1 N-acetyltransferase [Gordonia sp. i37]
MDVDENGLGAGADTLLDPIARTVLSESVAWRSSWHPDGSRHIVDGAFEFYVDGADATLLRFHGPDGDPRRILDDALRTVSVHGASGLRITVGLGTFADLDDDEVARRGGTLVAVVDVVARAVDASVPDSIPVPTDIAVGRVRTAEDLALFASISERAWGFAPPVLADPDFDVADPTTRLFVAEGNSSATCSVPGKPVGDHVGAGGYELAGSTARFWGAAILPAYRGRGAYRALVAARLRDALGCGARLALVHAKQTSSPILQRIGFARYAQRRLTWFPVPGQGNRVHGEQR